MAIFLIDWENVQGKYGLDGSDYLTEKDIIYIFYSNASKNIKTCDLRKLEEKKCELRFCKLDKTGKNALDFYIASACGELIATGEKQIAIISEDNGFQALIEYYKKNVILEHKNVRIAIGPNIKMGITRMTLIEDMDRRIRISEGEKALCIDDYIKSKSKVIEPTVAEENNKKVQEKDVKRKKSVKRVSKKDILHKNIRNMLKNLGFK